MHNLRTVLLLIVLCALLQGVVSDRVAAQTFDDHRKLVESKFSALRDSDERKDFDDARVTLYQVLQKPEQGKQIEYLALFAKLLCEVDLRIDSLNSSETHSSASGDGLLGSGLLSGDESLFFDDLTVGQPAENGSVKNALNAKQRSLKRYLPKYSVAVSRSFYVIYRTVFSGPDDLRQILEKATGDEKHRKIMFDRLSAEFLEMDKKYTIVSGKLIPRRGKR